MTEKVDEFIGFNLPTDFDRFRYIHLDVFDIDSDEKFKDLCLNAGLDYKYIIEKLKQKDKMRIYEENLYHGPFGRYIMGTFTRDRVRHSSQDYEKYWDETHKITICINYLFDTYLHYEFIIPINHKIISKTTFSIKCDQDTTIKIPFEDIILSGLENYAETSFKNNLQKMLQKTPVSD